MKNEKSANFKRFATDVVAACENMQATVDLDVNIIVTDGSDTLIIQSNNIEKYYEGYIMSHQERVDAVKRAAKYVERMVDNWKK